MGQVRPLGIPADRSRNPRPRLLVSNAVGVATLANDEINLFSRAHVLNIAHHLTVASLKRQGRYDFSRPRRYCPARSRMSKTRPAMLTSPESCARLFVSRHRVAASRMMAFNFSASSMKAKVLRL